MLPFEIEKRLPEIRQEVERDGVELVDIVFRRMTGRSILTVVADKIGGITLEECVDINQRLGRLMDEWSAGAEGIQGAYYLEVNSPGLDRPMKSQRELERAVDSDVRVTFRLANGTVMTKVGKLMSVDAEGMKLDTNGQEWSVTHASAIKTVHEIKFKK